MNCAVASKLIRKDVELYHLQPIYMVAAFIDSNHYVTITMYGNSVC